ncbi:MAG: cyclopropane fatty acyl phospholipid synthase [Pseudohaliea sp.]
MPRALARDSAGEWEHAAHPPPRLIAGLLEGSGVRIDGDAPWDLKVHDPEVYRRVLASGSLGFGEAYMDGLWDCSRLDELFNRLLRARIDDRLRHLPRLRLLTSIGWNRLLNLALNRQSRSRAFEVGRKHYDIGNDVFEAMLDPSLSYSCAYWGQAGSLADAQHDKLAMICAKLRLGPGERLLDIGCGWGGLAEHAARHHGVEVLGITVSREQQALARERCAGLPVDIALRDYRELQGRFDKVVSVGMLEHVGPKNYGTFFRVVDEVLAPDGLALVQSIGASHSHAAGDPWIDRYIFPNGKLPSAAQLTAALEGQFALRDWHEFGADYDRTLLAWWRNFDAVWPALAARYGERFYRMWRYYLLSCAGTFRAGRSRLWQLVLSRADEQSDYRSWRPGSRRGAAAWAL